MTDVSGGFLRPTTTPTPDELFDVWLSKLSGSELKVLLYIVRRTFGFQKEADAISLSQICEGITTRDGRTLDRGTGLARSTASAAVKQLEEYGLIAVARVQARRAASSLTSTASAFAVTTRIPSSTITLIQIRLTIAPSLAKAISRIPLLKIPVTTHLKIR